MFERRRLALRFFVFLLAPDECGLGSGLTSDTDSSVRQQARRCPRRSPAIPGRCGHRLVLDRLVGDGPRGMIADDVRGKARLVREGSLAFLALVWPLCRRTHVMQGVKLMVPHESTLVGEGPGTPGTDQGGFGGLGRRWQCFCRTLQLKNSKHPRVDSNKDKIVVRKRKRNNANAQHWKIAQHLTVQHIPEPPPHPRLNMTTCLL